MRVSQMKHLGHNDEFPFEDVSSHDRERAAELESLPTEELLEMASTIDERERRQITTEAEATDGSNSSRYYHTRLSRNPSSRVNYNER